MWEDVSGAVAHPFIMALLSSTAGSDSQCTPHTHIVKHCNAKFVLLTFTLPINYYTLPINYYPLPMCTVHV